MTRPTRSQIDVTDCDREPIWIPGSIQPHGFLLVLEEPSFQVVQAAVDTTNFLQGVDPLGKTLDEIFGPKLGRQLATDLGHDAYSDTPRQLRTFQLAGDLELRAIAHRHQGRLIVEFERTTSAAEAEFVNLYSMSTRFVGALQSAVDVAELQSIAAEEVRKLTGFDRVLVYQFDDEWNGTVVAESRNERLPSYMGLRFPASDIPAQARDLYRLNRLRMIVTADYRPVPLTPAVDPATGKPLDMSYCVLRSVSPVHLEYMRNMGTAASMSISVIDRVRLWGLISCHHAEPRLVPFVVRSACDFIGQVLGLQIQSRMRSADAEQRLRLRSKESRLLTAMAASDDYRVGLITEADDLLAIATAQGAAVVTEDKLLTVGATPGEAEIRRIVGWLAQDVRREVFTSSQLPEEAPQLNANVAGLAAIAISKLHRSYVLWFRSEFATIVTWAGDPRKSTSSEPGDSYLHPRKSFERWIETVRGRSLPFSDVEIEMLVELRNSILGIVLRTAEEMADLTAELRRSNQELEAFSYSVSHDLRAPFRHIVGYSELLRERAQSRLTPDDKRHLAIIAESAQTAGQLVDNLLAFSRMGRARLERRLVDLNVVLAEARDDVMLDAKGRAVRWEIAELPEVYVDPAMLRSAVHNLLSNALKFTRHRAEAVVRVEAWDTSDEHVIAVRDNGVGFDMAYVDKLFGVFQRMHRMEDYEGTGIGLANVRRIISRHGGRTWAEGEPDHGASFYFSLPKRLP